ncbi:uncharacterized protein PY17X_1220600 [Plasmodium yoelii]|uniref:Leucine-rich repeat protein n=3 Tax=Plasmodium yoelii TaxID=5861 RepID=A0AAE9WZH8_PLAYO|nr:uncharacterized protein PY17X_1220600 [Plasmodium yoelii]EAA15830.1 Leucine Rich Repeat, putative [Plasmodium yoelii yoelii]WBY59213.1 hypothetical protein Py17XNL_001205070 [Plasmodium yoelii yoelii]CDU19372.1 conserved Plasmodium protein, unknown function [Plasmodium yoelii]VTZ80007.1 conserved Plasmodium protein, unknown function [Plasmodium yoelii]|eukprot:XP_724265.1 uncharacterized protein PY17X_1220600 [Plasmodium yoelii]
MICGKDVRLKNDDNEKKNKTQFKSNETNSYYSIDQNTISDGESPNICYVNKSDTTNLHINNLINNIIKCNNKFTKYNRIILSLKKINERIKCSNKCILNSCSEQQKDTKKKRKKNILQIKQRKNKKILFTNSCRISTKKKKKCNPKYELTEIIWKHKINKKIHQIIKRVIYITYCTNIGHYKKRNIRNNSFIYFLWNPHTLKQRNQEIKKQKKTTKLISSTNFTIINELKYNRGKQKYLNVERLNMVTDSKKGNQYNSKGEQNDKILYANKKGTNLMEEYGAEVEDKQNDEKQKCSETNYIYNSLEKQSENTYDLYKGLCKNSTYSGYPYGFKNSENKLAKRNKKKKSLISNIFNRIDDISDISGNNNDVILSSIKKNSKNFGKCNSEDNGNRIPMNEKHSNFCCNDNKSNNLKNYVYKDNVLKTSDHTYTCLSKFSNNKCTSNNIYFDKKLYFNKYNNTNNTDNLFDSKNVRNYSHSLRNIIKRDEHNDKKNNKLKNCIFSKINADNNNQFFLHKIDVLSDIHIHDKNNHSNCDHNGRKNWKSKKFNYFPMCLSIETDPINGYKHQYTKDSYIIKRTYSIDRKYNVRDYFRMSYIHNNYNSYKNRGNSTNYFSQNINCGNIESGQADRYFSRKKLIPNFLNKNKHNNDKKEIKYKNNVEKNVAFYYNSHYANKHNVNFLSYQNNNIYNKKLRNSMEDRGYSTNNSSSNATINEINHNNSASTRASNTNSSNNYTNGYTSVQPFKRLKNRVNNHFSALKRSYKNYQKNFEEEKIIFFNSIRNIIRIIKEIKKLKVDLKKEKKYCSVICDEKKREEFNNLIKYLLHQKIIRKKLKEYYFKKIDKGLFTFLLRSNYANFLFSEEEVKLLKRWNVIKKKRSKFDNDNNANHEENKAYDKNNKFQANDNLAYCYTDILNIQSPDQTNNFFGSEKERKTCYQEVPKNEKVLENNILNSEERKSYQNNYNRINQSYGNNNEFRFYTTNGFNHNTIEEYYKGNYLKQICINNLNDLYLKHCKKYKRSIIFNVLSFFKNIKIKNVSKKFKKKLKNNQHIYLSKIYNYKKMLRHIKYIFIKLLKKNIADINSIHINNCFLNSTICFFLFLILTIFKNISTLKVVQCHIYYSQFYISLYHIKNNNLKNLYFMCNHIIHCEIPDKDIYDYKYYKNCIIYFDLNYLKKKSKNNNKQGNKKHVEDIARSESIIYPLGQLENYQIDKIQTDHESNTKPHYGINKIIIKKNKKVIPFDKISFYDIFVAKKKNLNKETANDEHVTIKLSNLPNKEHKNNIISSNIEGKQKDILCWYDSISTAPPLLNTGEEDQNEEENNMNHIHTEIEKRENKYICDDTKFDSKINTYNIHSSSCSNENSSGNSVQASENYIYAFPRKGIEYFNLEKLRVLRLSSNKLGDDALIYLSSLIKKKKLNKLKILDLRWNNFTYKSLLSLLFALINNVKNDYKNNTISDLKKNKQTNKLKLRKLLLSGNNIDSSLYSSFLSGFCTCNYIVVVELDFSMNIIDNECFPITLKYFKHILNLQKRKKKNNNISGVYINLDHNSLKNSTYINKLMKILFKFPRNKKKYIKNKNMEQTNFIDQTGMVKQNILLSLQYNDIKNIDTNVEFHKYEQRIRF